MTDLHPDEDPRDVLPLDAEPVRPLRQHLPDLTPLGASRRGPLTTWIPIGMGFTGDVIMLPACNACGALIAPGSGPDHYSLIHPTASGLEVAVLGAIADLGTIAQTAAPAVPQTLAEWQANHPDEVARVRMPWEDDPQSEGMGA